MISTNASSTPERPPREARFPHTLEEVRAERGRRSLEAYVREAWKQVNPETPLVWNWHIGAISELLEAVTAGEVQNALINVPPGFAKSLIVSVLWPTWEWGPKGLAHLSHLAASNTRELAVRDTLRARRVIESEWYQRHYGDAFSLAGDQNRKMRFDNDRGGSRFATSVGSGTGERGNRVILDDPHQLDHADHPDAIKAAVEYKNVTLDSRFADREHDSSVVVQQRVVRRDVSGDILKKMEQGGRHYEVLCLPMRHNPSFQAFVTRRNKRDPKYLKYPDPRTRPGELLDPKRYSALSVKQDEVQFGGRAAAILDQNPEESTSSVFRRTDFARYQAGDLLEHPASGRYVILDMADEVEEENDFTAWVAFDLTPDYKARLVDVGAEKLEHPDRLDLVRNLATLHDFDGALKEVVIERTSGGRSALQSFTSAADAWLAPYINGFDPGTRSKVQRAKSASLWTRQGCVLLPRPDEAGWVEAFTEELFDFPDVEHDDRTDAFVIGILWMENLLREGLTFREGGS
ncbi:MAG: hypothetical protein M3P49_05840 [Actinomycetota bacterium]|nr:hypothetical protein [Actinomycetota bacterium]